MGRHSLKNSASLQPEQRRPHSLACIACKHVTLLSLAECEQRCTFICHDVKAGVLMLLLVPATALMQIVPA